MLLDAGSNDAVPFIELILGMVMNVSNALSLSGKLQFVNIFFVTAETIHAKKKLNYYMSKSSKLAIGVSMVSGALLAAWLLTGTRKEKTKKLISKGKSTITKTFMAEKQESRNRVADDSEVHYV
jgi:hypothetical protein